MMVLIVTLVGAISLTRLPIDLMPDITYPTLSVFADYGNASPEEIEQLVTRPIEEAMTAVPGVEEVSSISSEGSSQVRVSFSWGTDLDAAAGDVRDRLDQVLAMLPEDVERPTLRKFDLASFPIITLGASSHMDPIHLKRLIDDQVKSRLERLPGVASINIRGGLDREIHVALDPNKIKALGLALDQILARIKAENVSIPAGVLERDRLDVMIRTPGEFTTLAQLADTTIAIREGVPIRLREIAAVRDAWEKPERIVRINGQPGVRIAINKQSGTNTVEVSRGVLREVAAINRDLPQIDLTPVVNTADYIQRSIANVGTSLLYGGLLAVLVLLVFLREVRSTLIIAAAIPISIVATFALIYFGGFTLNLMTLGGLALGVGMLVDNAIVVLENIYRLRGQIDPRSAALDGSEEVAGAVTASTLTTVAVFLPMVFISGMSGVMFKQLAYIVSFALGCSLLVALFFVPMLSAHILPSRRPGTALKSAWAHRVTGLSLRIFTGIEMGYKGLLHLCLEHRPTVVIASVALLAASLALVPVVGVELMPATDEGEVLVNAEMAVGTRIEVVAEKLAAVEAIIQREVPEVLHIVTFVGGSRWMGKASHTGEIRVSLKPRRERERSSEEIAAALRAKIGTMPGIRLRLRAGTGLFILRMGSTEGDKIQVEIRGHDMPTADGLAQRVSLAAAQVPGVTDVQISRESGTPEELILVDRDKAAAMKLTVAQIAGMLQTILSGTVAGYYREEGDEFKIRVQLAEAEKIDLDALLDLTLTNADGQPVVLRNVVRAQPWSGPVLIERKDQERIVTVNVNFTDRDMGSVIGDVREQLRAIPVPQDYSIVFGGDYEEQQKAFRELLLGLVLALVLVYMVMASLYESLRDPFIVMFSVPFAAIGVILILLITRTTFNIQSFIGCIMLGGIVVNNAILLVDHINLLRRRDALPLRQAIEEAGRRRIRPILMTALTTMLALTPLALGLGEGGEAQAPMARAVIGGLLSSTLITLVFVPTIYSLFEGKGKWHD
jgi:HAE1 family hydrophobic/amphiphilic exporter-1